MSENNNPSWEAHAIRVGEELSPNTGMWCAMVTRTLRDNKLKILFVTNGIGDPKNTPEEAWEDALKLEAGMSKVKPWEQLIHERVGIAPAWYAFIGKHSKDD
jgi:hypothetical protein